MTLRHGNKSDEDKAALSPQDAIRLGYSEAEVAEAEPYAHLIVSEHERLGTSLDRWEPQTIDGEQIATPFIEAAEEKLAERLVAEVDPVLDEAQQGIETVKLRLGELDKEPKTFVASESGTVYALPDAVDRFGELVAKIELDELASSLYHRRVPGWLRMIALLMPWLEFAGLLSVVGYFLDVPLFQPWLDFGAWILSVVIAASTMLGLNWLVHHAAWNHNHGREAYGGGNRPAGEKDFRRRDWYLGLLVLTVMAAITGGIVLRGTTTLADTDVSSEALMIFVAVVAAAIMPSLSYLAIALDGSRISRERDSLAADLDADLYDHDDIIAECSFVLDDVGLVIERLSSGIFTDVCNGVQEVVDGAHRLYGLVCILIGESAAKPLAFRQNSDGNFGPQTKAAVIDFQAGDGTAAGGFVGRIGTTIPGARDVDLRPLAERFWRLKVIQDNRRQLHAEVDALWPHPWRTATDKKRESETLESLFREVFDLVEQSVASISDDEVSYELHRVLEAAGIDNSEQSLDTGDLDDPNAVGFAKPRARLRLWGRGRGGR